MALQTNELYSQSSQQPVVRMQPAPGPGSIYRGIFAAGTAKLLAGCPVFVDAATGFLARLVPGSATAQETEVFGFVWIEPVQLLAGGEVMGNVMIRGAIPVDEVLIQRNAADATVPGSAVAGTPQQLYDALRKPIVRERGLVIEGLSRIGGNAGLSGP